MKNRRAKPYKKTEQMVNNYKTILKEPTREYEDTVENDITNLEGSNISRQEKIQEDIPIQRKPIKLCIQDWFRENWVMVFLWGAITLSLTWGLDMKLDIREIKTRLEYIEACIENLDDEYAAKGEITIEINNIKDKINNGKFTKIDEIKEQLNKIEQIIKNE